MTALADLSGLFKDWEMSLMEADCPFRINGLGGFDFYWPGKLAACLFCASMLEQTQQDAIRKFMERF